MATLDQNLAMASFLPSQDTPILSLYILLESISISKNVTNIPFNIKRKKQNIEILTSMPHFFHFQSAYK